MRIFIEVEVEDEIEKHQIPEPRRAGESVIDHCKRSGYRRCGRCGGLEFYHVKHKRLDGSNGDTQAPYYCSEDSPATAPFVVCVKCHKIMFVQ